MPRHVETPVPDARALLEALALVGVSDAPTEGDPDALAGLLFLAAWLHDRQKAVSFEGFSWESPRFTAADEKVTVELEHATLAHASDLAGALCHGPRITALDARPSGLKEFELGHLLYGTPTMYARRGAAKEARDGRIDTAREAGWAKTLKDHNLLAGRGLVVHDDDQGLFLSDPETEDVPGVLALLASGDVVLWWNPFAEGSDAEMQYWLSWGRGLPASQWREMVSYGREDE